MLVVVISLDIYTKQQNHNKTENQYDSSMCYKQFNRYSTKTHRKQKGKKYPKMVEY